MNREIKFRAWNNYTKEMIYQYGNTTKQNSIMEAQFIFDEMGTWVYVFAFGQEHYVEIMDFALMQNTGLKDRNGKEIYEGDIVKHRFIEGDTVLAEEINVVIYKAVGAFAFAPTLKHRGLTVIDLWHKYKSATSAVHEVIGNIYENPELLEVEK